MSQIPSPPERGVEREAGIELEVFRTEEYRRFDHLASFLEQFRLVMGQEPASVLEVGPGSGHVTAWMRHVGIDVATVDVNPRLQPTYLCNVADLAETVGDDKRDVVLCAEVLEHLPWEEFEQSVANLARCARKAVVISLPRFDRAFLSSRLYFWLPKLVKRTFTWSWSLPVRTPLYKAHYWEINYKREQSLKNVCAAIRKHGRELEHHRFDLNPYHHFFVLKL